MTINHLLLHSFLGAEPGQDFTGHHRPVYPLAQQRHFVLTIFPSWLLLAA